MKHNLPKSFCIAPWVHLFADPNGDLRSCCTVQSDKRFGNAKQFPKIIDAANSEGMKELRRAFLKGEKPEICSNCWIHEDTSASGGNSYRSYLNRLFLENSLDLLAQTQEDGSIENFKLKYYDFRWANTCNFACISCGSFYSSRWAVESGQYDHVFQIPNKKSLLDELINERLDDIEVLYLVGGEPFLIPEHWALLEALSDSGRAKNISMRINTNLSVLQFEKKNALNYLPNFKDVEIVASLDHIGEKAELIRYGTNWQDILNNLTYIRDLNQPNINVVTNTVVTALNILDLPYIIRTFVEMWKEKLLFPQTLYRALDPAWLNSRNLPRDELEKVAEELTQVQKEIPEALGFFKGVVVPDVRDFILTDSPYNKEIMKQKFIEEMKWLDIKRKTDWRKTLPELANIIK